MSGPLLPMLPRPAAPPQGMPPQGMPPQAAPMGMRPPGAMKRGGSIKDGEGRMNAENNEESDEKRARGGRTQKMQEVGVPSESLMQSKRGGGLRKREMGGSAGVPANPTQMSPQQLQRIAQIRKAEAQAKAAQKPGMEPPMGAATAAGMSGMPTQKRGGEVHVKEHVRRAKGGHVPMEAGAGGGEGRIEKMRAYGSGRGFKPKKEPLHD